jgi:hypothetical protein
MPRLAPVTTATGDDERAGTVTVLPPAGNPLGDYLATDGRPTRSNLNRAFT